ncbi:MAG: ribose-phosphate pyrophosphokinase [Rhodospirillales bacterium]|nr:ribose-phosphate pyrophosphokinase [Rhodospirillales bacterium]
MSTRPLSLFGLGSSRAYAERIAAELNVALAPHEERGFEDAEHKARPLLDVRGHDTFVVHALDGDAGQSPNDKLCRLLFFCGALRDAGAERVSAVVPYLCYARKDRRTKPNDPIITRYVAALFEAIGIDRVIAVEVHNVAAFENAFRRPTVHVDSAPLFARHFASLLGEAPVVAVSPDAGGAKRVEQFRAALEVLTERDVASAYVEKFRSSGVVSGGRLAGDVRGRTAVILDDLISTGTTLARAAAACHAGGAARIFAAAAHGLFIGGAPGLLDCPLIERIAVLDTVPPARLAAEAVAARLHVIASAPTVARRIAELHDAA